MEMYYKLVTIHLLLASLFLGSFASSHEGATRTSESNPKCRGLSDESGIMILDCGWQGLMSVPVISPGQLVHTLDLSHNTLSMLHNDSFLMYPNLKQLILSSDNVTMIEVNTFSSLKALRKVDLSYNSLKFIYPSMFVHNIKLETLSLQGNSLLPLDLRTPLLVSKALRSLDLSHCYLPQLSTESLSGLPELKILDLSHNNLQQLSLNNMSALSSLWISGNPWKCDCHFHALLMWVSSNQMLDSDIGRNNTIQCWQGDELRDVTTKEEQDSICKEVIGLPNISLNVRSDMDVTDSDKVENTHSREEDSEVKFQEWLDELLLNNSDSAFSGINNDDVWMYADDYGDVFNSVYEDFEGLNKDTVSSSAAEIHQNDTDSNLAVSIEVGDKHPDITRKDEDTDSTIQLSPLYHNFSSEVGFYDEYEDSEELKNGSIPLSAAEIPGSDRKADMSSNLTVSIKFGDNHTEVSGRNDVTDPDIMYYENEFYDYDYSEIETHEDNDDKYENEFYDYSEEFYASPSAAEITNSQHEDNDDKFSDARHISKNSDLQKSDLKNNTTDFSSHNNDFITDGTALSNNSLRTKSNSILTDNNKDDNLNNNSDFDYKCIFCDEYADSKESDKDNILVLVSETQTLKHEDKIADPLGLLENVNYEETVRNDDTDGSTIQLPSIQEDFSPEDNDDPFAFLLDYLDIAEKVNNEMSPSATNFPNLIDDDNFDIDYQNDSDLTYFYSGENEQEQHETLINQINAKPPNKTHIDMAIFNIGFLIFASIISVVVFVLIVTVYCINKVCLMPALPMEANVYKKLEKSVSKEQLLQNV